jgi:hypothetical protein
MEALIDVSDIRERLARRVWHAGLHLTSEEADRLLRYIRQVEDGETLEYDDNVCETHTRAE